MEIHTPPGWRNIYILRFSYSSNLPVEKGEKRNQHSISIMTISLVDTHTLDAVSVVVCAMKEGKEKKKKKKKKKNKYTSDYGTE